MLYALRALLEFGRGRHKEAMTAQRAAEGIERGLTMQHIVARRALALKLEMLVRVGETELVQLALDEMDEDVRAAGEMRVVLAALRLAGDDAEGAAAALVPILARASPIENPRWAIQAMLLKASIDDALATLAPAHGRWSARSSLPSPAVCCFRSCFIQRRSCSSATRDFGPLMPR